MGTYSSAVSPTLKLKSYFAFVKDGGGGREEGADNASLSASSIDVMTVMMDAENTLTDTFNSAA